MSKEKNLLEEYTHLVQKIASGFQRKLPRTVLREDLVAAGMGGLWDAIRRHPDGGDESFEWYVRVRIRGAILDELRNQDWLPRRARGRAEANETLAPSITRLDDMMEWDQERALAQEYLTDERLDEARQVRALLSYIDELPDRERLIISEHYFRGVKFKDLAVELDVSEPRISQLHSRAIGQLRQLAKDNDNGTTPGAPPESTRRRRRGVPRR